MPAATQVGVLVIDDDDEIRETLRFVLEDTDYLVLEAPDGEVGLEALRASKRPLVVLLDLMMPRFDGLAVLRALRDDPPLARQHRYILITANGQTFAPPLSTLLEMLDVPVVRKPFDIDSLLEAVARAALRLPHA